MPRRGPITKATRRPARAPWPPEAKRVRSLLEGLEELYPEVECELDYQTPFQLLCATILSAQTTDERVNKVTPTLFARFPDAKAMAAADVTELEAIVKTTGFYRQKAKNLKATAEGIVTRFGGQVPRTIDELITLPGAARKTANVVLGTAFGIPSGVVVDTHVQRLSLRLALTRQTDVKKIELELMKVIPQTSWIRFSHQIIWHGRRVCFARKPACETCTLAAFCPSAGKEA